MQQQRQQALELWLENIFPQKKYTLNKLAGDASFRRYFRVHEGNQTYIVMDAPPDKENSQAFVSIAQSYTKLGLHVPEILVTDLTQGFLLLSDLGDRLYLSELNTENADLLYEQALAIIPSIQACSGDVSNWQLPHFGEKMIVNELQLFLHWFLQQHLGLELNSATQAMFATTFNHLIQVANEQPQVCMHRDYHSRNLLRITNTHVGVLDFQDASWGPITYDVVSLLRDCYVAWAPSKVHRWALDFYELCRDSTHLQKYSNDQFLYWFDLVGVQRHLKILGIFTRLYHRDGKNMYLGDIPRTLNYLVEVSENYAELKGLQSFLLSTVMPQLEC